MPNAIEPSRAFLGTRMKSKLFIGIHSIDDCIYFVHTISQKNPY